MKLITILLALLFAPLLAKDKPTNVLLITADDLGYEVLPFFDGTPKDITPTQASGYRRNELLKCP